MSSRLQSWIGTSCLIVLSLCLIGNERVIAQRADVSRQERNLATRHFKSVALEGQMKMGSSIFSLAQNIEIRFWRKSFHFDLKALLLRKGPAVGTWKIFCLHHPRSKRCWTQRALNPRAQLLISAAATSDNSGETSRSIFLTARRRRS